jgi:hypothetical protein
MNSINKYAPHARFDKWSKRQRTIQAKALIHKILYFITKPFHKNASQYFEMKFMKNACKLKIILQKKSFHEALIASTFNMAKPKTAKSDQAVKLSQEWMQEIHRKKGVEVKHLDYILKAAHSPLGLCNGISLNIAAKLLLQNKSVDHVVQSLEKGCGTKAYASHNLYYMLLRSYAYQPTLEELMHLMKKTQKSPHAPFLRHFTLEDVEKMLPLEKDAVGDLADLQAQRKRVDDPKEIAQLEFAMQLLTLWKTLKERNSFDACLQFKIDGAVPAGDPKTNHWILSCFYTLYATFHTQQTAAKLGLELNDLVEPLGISSLGESDERYLKNLDQLGNGCYNIFMLTDSRGGHTITLIREEGKDTLIDPNGFILRSKSSEETKGLLKKVLEFYPGLHKPIIGSPNHRLIIQKYEKAAL